MKLNRKGQSVNVLFTMLLFLVFVMCALFTVLIGGRVYENINIRNEKDYTGSVALGYLANKVRQADSEGAVSVITVDGTEVLELAQDSGESPYVTWIYYKDGSICELFTNPEYGLGLEDGLSIIDCGGLLLEQDGNLLTFTTVSEGQEDKKSLTLSLRSGGEGHE